jgi:uncharacterized membrane protein
VVTWPVIVAMTGLSWGEALLAELGLTLAYAGYAYLYHLGYDRLRPVRAAPAPADRASFDTSEALAPKKAHAD